MYVSESERSHLALNVREHGDLVRRLAAERDRQCGVVIAITRECSLISHARFALF